MNRETILAIFEKLKAFDVGLDELEGWPSTHDPNSPVSIAADTDFKTFTITFEEDNKAYKYALRNYGHNSVGDIWMDRSRYCHGWGAQGGGIIIHKAQALELWCSVMEQLIASEITRLSDIQISLRSVNVTH